MPYYLGIKYGCETSVYYYRNKSKDNLNYKNIAFNEIRKNCFKYCGKLSFFRKINYLTSNFIKVIRKRAKEIDILMLYHFGFDKYFIMNTYKKYNKKGKIYLKLDATSNIINNFGSYFLKEDYRSILIRNIIIRMIEQITLISCETNYVYELIKNSPLWKHMKEKLAIIPNGFDYEEIAECGIEFKSYRDKENTFCVIGRLSAPEKNVSLILEAIKGIDLKDWKIIFVGYIEKYSELEKNINDILIIKGAKNIIITGEIKERKSLYEIYNKSKCFILSSNSESYGNVLLEASFFGNYIISTRVGVANDITENGKLGSIIEPGNVKELALAIKKVINNEIDIEAITNVLTKKVNREFKWISIVENEAFHKLFK